MAEPNGVVQVVQSPSPPRKLPDKRDFKVLLEAEYEDANSQLPRGAWEPLAKFRSERLAALERLARDQERRPRELFPHLIAVDEAICSKWDEVEEHIRQLVRISPGVNALRSNQLVAAFRGADEWKTNNAKGVAVEPVGGGGKKGGVFSRGR